MKIYDCCMFFNEIELLELRLQTLNNIVDYFIIVECGMTHQGEKRKYILEKNWHLFIKYRDKIRYIKIDELPSQNDTWKNENFHRNCISKGIEDAKDNDIILISDLDEIPNTETIKYSIQQNYDLCVFKQKFFYYYVNCKCNEEWFGTVFVKKQFFTNPQELRNIRTQGIIEVSNGGWHYSFLGGKERIKTKIQSFAHNEFNIPEILNEEHIIECLKTGKDIFNRQGNIFNREWVSIENVDHNELKSWLEKYPQFFKII